LLHLALLLMLLAQAPPAAAPAELSGQLVMTDGKPAIAVRVAAIQAPPPNIRPADGQNYYASVSPASIAVTDDQGRFRLTRIPPGRYYVVAGIVGHATYYPATTDIDAATVLTVEPNARMEAIDFKLLTAAGSRVRGRITPPPASGRQERAVVSGVELGEILEAPVNADGTFELGRIPEGEYLLSFFPPPPGMASIPFQVTGQDVAALAGVRPPTRTVTGRIVVDKGPLPPALLGFISGKEQEYVSGTIHPDLTFTAQLHASRHRVDLGGLPVGYGVTSVRIGSREAREFTVDNEDVSDIVITVAAPDDLPRLTGRIAGATGTLDVEITGPIVGKATTRAKSDGSFEFPALPPGLYRVTVPQRGDLGSTEVILTIAGANVQLGR
jgi:hypothetical protein